MEKKIQSFWFGNSFSTMEKLCVNSFLKNGHSFDLYTYDEISNLPNGINQVDANTILNRNEIFFDNNGGIAAFSDWFRYEMLFKCGGWWVDLDVICLKPFSIDADYCFATENFSTDYKTGITCCVIKSIPDAEFLRLMLEYIRPLEKNSDIRWNQFGPPLIHSTLTQFESEQYVQGVDVFCPIDWTEVHSILNKSVELPQNSLAVHLWNHLWRIHELDKEGTYDSNSIYEKLKGKYL